MTSMTKMRENEQGMVSILVTMIMIVVITLIVLGFSQVTRRNQREALDNQLSTQAYYAAESGVNAAVNYLTQPANIGAQINTVGNCASFIGTLHAGGTLSTLDSSTKTQYTCLMVDTNPSTLSVAPLTQGNSQILYMANADGAGGASENWSQLKFSWSPETGSPFSSGTCGLTGTGGSGPTGTQLPSMSNWDCKYGILRLDLVDASNINNSALDSDQGTMSFYMIPSYRTGGSFVQSTTVSWPPQTQPVNPTTGPNCTASVPRNCPVQIVPVNCPGNGANGCSLQINFKNPPAGSTQYFARLTMMYQDSGSVIIAGGDAAHAINAVTGIGTNFVGGQAMIDSTGQSQDELRRIQVRIPLTTSTNTFPAYGLQTTQSICKQIQDGPSLYTDNCPGHP